MQRAFYEKYAGLIVLALALMAPILVWGAAKAIASNSNQITDWLPQNFEETQRLIWFAERFGSDEIVVVGWDDCAMSDQRIDEFVDRARTLQSETGGTPVFTEVTSGRHVLKQLMEEPLALPERIARQRMRSWIVGPDDATCIVARVGAGVEAEFRFEALGKIDRIGAVDDLRQIAIQIGIPESDIRIAGPTVDSVAIDLAGRKWTVEMGLASVIIGFVLAWICLRTWWQVIAVFATSLSAAATSLAIVHFTGNTMDAVLMSMPALIFVLTTSGGIHLTHYLSEELRGPSAPRAPLRAIQIGMVPCSLACITTTIGMSSLAISRVRPVIRYGVFSAIGVVVSLVLLLLLWPSLCQLFLRRDSHERSGKSEGSAWWEPLFQLSTRFYPAVLTVTLLSMVVLGFGLTQINSSVHLKSLLPKSSDLLLSYDWLQEKIGPMVPVEVVMQFPKDDDAPALETFRRAAAMEELRRAIEQLELSGGTIAATTFAPDLPIGLGVRNTITRTVMAREIQKNLPLYGELGFIETDDTHELWRISTRVSAAEDDFAVFLDQIQETVDESLEAENKDRDAADQITAKICGAVPLVQMAQKQLLSDFIWSLTLAFFLIGLTIMVMLRNGVAGAVSMIPNAFPTVVVFGWMGLRGTSIDIGTMMTASVALGIAVDDTLHFLVWVRRAMLAGKTRHEAIRAAFEQSASAMLQTSLICGVGMAPFIVSPFGPIAGFAGMMFALLMAALIGDLILLPALIASPLGKCFVPKGGS